MMQRSQTSATQDEITIENRTSATQNNRAFGRVSARGSRIDRRTDAAVLSYIKAVRALGRSTISTGEIARALKLSLREAEASSARLANKGVKFRT